MTREELLEALLPVMELVNREGLTSPKDLEATLNEDFPPTDPWYAGIKAGCEQAVADGWMCKHEAGGIRYGRVIRPDAASKQFSVDVVSMDEVVGPEHRHPLGEVDLVMPLSGDPHFDGRGAGWKVYGPGSQHSPTVEGGAALVLYLLPEGRIDFLGQ